MCDGESKGGDETKRLWSAGLPGFVNAKDLAPDPEGRVESPKDFKQGRTGFTAHAGNFAVATVWRNGCWPGGAGNRAGQGRF